MVTHIQEFGETGVSLFQSTLIPLQFGIDFWRSDLDATSQLWAALLKLELTNCFVSFRQQRRGQHKQRCHDCTVGDNQTQQFWFAGDLEILVVNRLQIWIRRVEKCPKTVSLYLSGDFLVRPIFRG